MYPHDDHEGSEDHSAADADESGDDSGEEGEEGVESEFLEVPQHIRLIERIMNGQTVLRLPRIFISKKRSKPQSPNELRSQ
mmetsp:Transcript_19958/g.41856  ORF Transcript_19958/g.41856 Transcript_19958/m.41856 type:complete len:81 (+) Transcript_19958:608-850(+)